MGPSGPFRVATQVSVRLAGGTQVFGFGMTQRFVCALQVLVAAAHVLSVFTTQVSTGSMQVLSLPRLHVWAPKTQVAWLSHFLLLLLQTTPVSMQVPVGGEGQSVSMRQSSSVILHFFPGGQSCRDKQPFLGVLLFLQVPVPGRGGQSVAGTEHCVLVACAQTETLPQLPPGLLHTALVYLQVPTVAQSLLLAQLAPVVAQVPP
jgi:hypothetical protein